MEINWNWKEGLKNNSILKKPKQDIFNNISLSLENDDIVSELDRKIKAMKKITKIQEEQLKNNIKYLKRLEEQRENVYKYL